MQLSTTPGVKEMINVTGFAIGEGSYASLLGFNVVSTVCCWALGALALLDNYKGRELVALEAEEPEEELKIEMLDDKLPVVTKDAADAA